jgi:5-keto-L-gluconate epimerase
MKLGVTVSAYATKFGPIVFRGSDIIKNIETIKMLGYEGVDLFADRRSDAEIDALRRAFEDNKIEVAMYLTIFLAEAGLNLSCKDHEKRKGYIKDYKEQIEKAHRLGTKRMPIGFIRGAMADDDTISDNLARLAASLDELCSFADNQDITLCLEPMNRYEINTLNNVDQSLEFIDKYRLDKLGLLLDTFHMNIEEPSIETSIRNAGNKIVHFHSPDSNRLAAGSGHLNYDSILKTLKATGYNGYLILEAFPQPDPITCASMSASFLRRKLAEVESIS